MKFSHLFAEIRGKENVHKQPSPTAVAVKKIRSWFYSSTMPIASVPLRVVLSLHENSRIRTILWRKSQGISGRVDKTQPTRLDLAHTRAQ